MFIFFWWGALAALASGASDEDGLWLLRQYAEEMDCYSPLNLPGLSHELGRWDGLHQLVEAGKKGLEAENSGQKDDALPVGEQSLHVLSETLMQLMLPYGVADPVLALQCPLATASVLQIFAHYCVRVRGDNCIQRSLRVLHLAKLMMLFRFTDHGALFPQSRWMTDMNNMNAHVMQLREISASLEEEQMPPPVKEKLDIAIVSYCNYKDPTFPLPKYSKTSKQAYADYHGYTLYHLEKPIVKSFHPWMNKLLTVRKILKDHDYAFWVDCDAYFMNFDMRVEDIIRQKNDKGEGFDLLLAEDGNMINTGVFLLKNSEWGRRFLQETIDLLAAPMPFGFQHHNWHEQSPLMYKIMVPSVLKLDTFVPDTFDHRNAGYDHEHVLVIPQGWCNSYPKELVDKARRAMAHHPWTEGDYIISFNGCGSVLGGDRCLEVYRDYHAESMRKAKAAGVDTGWSAEL